jgi:broad specificity phosphatase PhoE
MAPSYKNRGLDALFTLAAATPVRPVAGRFLFVRHGETDGNRRHIFQRSDQPLNETGLTQAARAAERLARERVAAIRASSMSRAFTTAEIVARPHGLTPAPMDDLRERWFGDMVGKPASGYDWRAVPPNGESLETFVARTQRGLTEALAEADDTAVVAHGGTLYVIGPSLGLQIPDAHYANATPLLFERVAGAWRVKALFEGGEADNIV